MTIDEKRVHPRPSLFDRTKRIREQSRNFLLVAFGILVAFLLMLVYSTLLHTTSVNESDVNRIVANAMASATPRPPVGVGVYEKILPSVVLIDAKILQTGSEPDHHLGTGTLISDRGDILTARHVVNQAIEIKVVYFDATEAIASVVGEDAANDIAVLRANSLPSIVVPAVLAGSGGLSVGDTAIAVGHPFGIPYSLSQGVISGLHRDFKSKDSTVTITNTIQFDAAVNPGNSGGPLLDEHGEVVGIVTGLLNPSDQNLFIGIGFAVPIETAGGGGGSPPW